MVKQKAFICSDIILRISSGSFWDLFKQNTLL